MTTNSQPMTVGFALIGGGTLQSVLSLTRVRADRSAHSVSDEVLG
jgi:hypothetical protein